MIGLGTRLRFDTPPTSAPQITPPPPAAAPAPLPVAATARWHPGFSAVTTADDSTHPGPLGARLRITGGATPQYGVAAGL